MLDSRHSFKLLPKAEIKKIKFADTLQRKNFVVSEFKHDYEKMAAEEALRKKRMFLKLAGVVGLGAVATLVFPKKADALVFGSTPAANVVGIKDTENLRIDPAKEGQLPVALTDPGGSLKVAINESVAQLPVALTVAGNLKTSIAEATAPIGLKNVAGTTINPATQDTLATLSTTLATEESLTLLRRIAKLTDSLGVVDSAWRQRVAVEVMPTISTITTVTTVSNMTAVGGVDARYLQIDTAHNTYANAIRSHLTWS